MEFDYFYGEQSEAFAFYRTPKVFFTDERFKSLTIYSRILYGILLDRLSLSAKNGWKDKEGKVFVYMTIESIEAALGCAHQKACALMGELNSFGLIEIKKQGLGKPNRIYVKNFIPIGESYLQKYENHTSGGMEIIPTQVCNSYSNNTDINNTEYSNTYLPISGVKEREYIEVYLEDSLSIDALKNDYPCDRSFFDELLQLMVDTICQSTDTVRIGNQDVAKSIVKSRFMKLNYNHIAYVLDAYRENCGSVRNVRAYLLTLIYNAPTMMTAYYDAKVKRDMEEGKLSGITGCKKSGSDELSV